MSSRCPLNSASVKIGDAEAALFLGGCVFRIGFDGDFHVRTLFEAYFLALVIRQGVVDAYFSIQMIPAFNGYLCLFGHAWEWGLDDFFYRSRQDGTRFFVHGSPFEQIGLKITSLTHLFFSDRLRKL